MKTYLNDQAVSESLGYIIIFGIVVACIAIMFVVGNQIISSNQESSSFQSMGQSFNVIQSNLMTTASGSSPVKTTLFNTNYGTLSLLPESDSDSMFVIKYNGNEEDIRIGTLVFRSSSTKTIGLENGAIVSSFDWDTRNYSYMTKEPRIFYSNTTGTLMICTVNLEGSKSSLSTSFGSLKLISVGLPRVSTYNTSDPGTSVEIDIKTNFTNAWKIHVAEIPGLHGVFGASPANWVNVTLSDENNVGSGIKKVIIVKYDVQAELN